MTHTWQQRGAGGWLTFALAALLLGLPCPALAHPVPVNTYDRTIAVKLWPEPDAKRVLVTVHYRLELDELTVWQRDMPPFFEKIDLPKYRGKPDAFFDKFTEIYAPILADNLVAKADGKAIAFKCLHREHQRKDENGVSLGHLRCDFVFVGSFPLKVGQPQSFAFREGNYILEEGRILVAGGFPATSVIARPDGRAPWQLGPEASWAVVVNRQVAPDAALQKKAPIDLRPGEEEQLRLVSWDFECVVPERVPLPVELEEPRETSTPVVQPVKSSPAEATALRFCADCAFGAWPKMQSAAPAATPPEKRPSHDLFQLFTESEHGIVVILLLAGLIGAAHALTPGHGKTLVAAYLVGQRGTVAHALLLGVVTTITHTGVVLLIALGLLFVHEDSRERVAQLLGLGMGLALVCLGVWLLLQRLAGRADHFHIGGGNHHHGPTPPGKQRLGWGGLIVMGMTGGIAPCWDAVAMLIVAIGMNLLWLALPMLLAFSAGLAAVLVLIGILVVRARRFLDDRWSDSRVIRWLPIASALFITVMGVLVCIQGTQGNWHEGAEHHAPAPASRP